MNSPGGAPRPVRWALVAVCVVLWGAAFTASHTPASRMPELYGTDVSLHAMGFFVLGWVLFWTLTAHGAGRRGRLIVASAMLICYATLDESTQPLFERHGAVGDWVADVLGGAVALALGEAWLALLRIVRRRRA